jgi:hypothetical protein
MCGQMKTAPVQPELPAVAALRATWLTALPGSATLVCDLDGQTFYVTTSRDVFAATQRAACASMTGLAWRHTVSVASDGRAALALRDWLSHPYRHVVHCLGSNPTVTPDVSNCKLTISQVLEHFGARLVGVDPDPAALGALGPARGAF